MLPWRRNLYILFAVQTLSMAGFSIVVPFLPLYLTDLGVATWGTIEFWAGMVFSVQAVTMMVSAPFWGFVADRHGRKLMLVRATMGGAVILGAMGFARNAEELTLLRALQGMVTGTIPAASALVAATTPKEHTGEALGLLQTGAWTGVAVGPVIGGVIGDALGFRESFWITAGLLALAGFSVLFWVREDFKPAAAGLKRPALFDSYRALLHAPRMISFYGITFLQSLGRMLIYPVAALFVMELMGTSKGVATVTGLLMGSQAFTSSISAAWLGRIGDRVGHDKVLLGATLAAVVFYLPQPFVTAAWQLVALQALTGFANGGIIPTIGALMNFATPLDNQGATYGLNASVNSAGRGVAPMLGAGFAIWFGMRSVFVLAALVYGMAVLVTLHIRRTAPGPR